MEKIDQSNLNTKVIANFKQVKWTTLLFPSFILLVVFLFFKFYQYDSDFNSEYVSVQTNLFYQLNCALSQFPRTELNLTHLGDVLIVFPLLTIFFIYAPRFWSTLVTSSLLSLAVAYGLKKLFQVPRPSSMLGSENFEIIGTKLTGHNSLPSGHSMTMFLIITTLIYAFLPVKKTHRVAWWVSMIILGIVLISSRIGVGAHYPLDVFIGGVVGYILAVIGILINNQINLLPFRHHKNYNLVFIALFAGWIYLIAKKTTADGLLVYYLSIASLVVTIFFMINAYVKQKN